MTKELTPEQKAKAAEYTKKYRKENDFSTPITKNQRYTAEEAKYIKEHIDLDKEAAEKLGRSLLGIEGKRYVIKKQDPWTMIPCKTNLAKRILRVIFLHPGIDEKGILSELNFALIPNTFRMWNIAKNSLFQQKVIYTQEHSYFTNIKEGEQYGQQ